MPKCFATYFVSMKCYMNDICIGSMNARGLCQAEKRLDVLSWLKAKKLSICCIVDFHCKSTINNI